MSLYGIFYLLPPILFPYITSIQISLAFNRFSSRLHTFSSCSCSPFSQISFASFLSFISILPKIHSWCYQQMVCVTFRNSQSLLSVNQSLNSSQTHKSIMLLEIYLFFCISTCEQFLILTLSTAIMSCLQEQMFMLKPPIWNRPWSKKYSLITVLINSLIAKWSNYFYDCLTWFSAIYSYNLIE